MKTSYIVCLVYRGRPSDRRDANIRRVARRAEDGTGYCFSSNERDFTWTYQNKIAADKLRQRLIDGCPGVRVTLHTIGENEFKQALQRDARS